MREQTAWSFSLGQWLGVNVRVHMLVLLFAVVSVSLVWQVGDGDRQFAAMGVAAAVLVGWLLALAIHEVGHFFAAAHLGGDVKSLTIFPWGSDFDSSAAQGWTRFFVYLAGPSANLFVAAFGSVVAIVIFQASITPGFFNLLQPEDILQNQEGIENSLRIFIWANWFLAVVNLVPAFLFDGGYLVHALLQACWPRRSNQQQLMYCSLVTQLFAVAVLAVAVVAKTSGDSQVFPTWLGLALFGLVLMFASRAVPASLVRPRRAIRSESSRQNTTLTLERFEQAYGEESERFIEFSSFDDDPENENDESLSIWLKERQLERVEQAREREAEEERRADAILDKVHREGIESLSAEDRELLNRVSARYRNRQREEA